MKTFIAVFEVPDDYTPRDFIDNADGWFVNGEGEPVTVIGAKLKEVSNLKGKWIPLYPRTVGEWEYKCSNCNNRGIMYRYNFCPHCGADMRGGAENEIR